MRPFRVLPASSIATVARIVSVLCVGLAMLAAEGESDTLSLDGEWQIAEGSLDRVPASFVAVVPVPGLADLARPVFADVGRPRADREVFWYRRTFRVARGPADFAVLRLRQVWFGAEVRLNGQRLGRTDAAFTRSEFDAASALRWHGEENELLVAVGADRSFLPAGAPDGYDLEKVRYIPGIFDSVDLVVADAPWLERVQIAPDPGRGRVRFELSVRHTAATAAAPLSLDIRVTSAADGTESARDRLASPPAVARHQTLRGELSLAAPRLWSPDTPHLYRLRIEGAAGAPLETCFGLRSVRTDRARGCLLLNGQPFYLRGSNLMIQRFAEDAARGQLIWDREWVRRFLRACRDLNWNSMRWSLGFPPEFWYDLADEEGLFVQDEFPIWYVGNHPESARKRDALDRDTLVRQFTAWIEARANHPSVGVWDAQNETVTPVTGQAITLARDLDLSRRPWDNGWSPAVSLDDIMEAHPYLEGGARDVRFSELGLLTDIPLFHTQPNAFGLPVVINEYAALWLHRDGRPTQLTAPRWAARGGESIPAAERQRRYARYVAALTERFRALRNNAGVHHIAILGYDIPEAVVADPWIDVAALRLEPQFARHVRDAFAPVGLMLDEWSGEFAPRERRAVDVVVINDRAVEWQGEVSLHLLIRGEHAASYRAATRVPGFGVARVRFAPSAPPAPVDFQLCAEITGPDGRPVQSWRDARVVLRPLLSRPVAPAATCDTEPKHLPPTS